VTAVTFRRPGSGYGLNQRDTDRHEGKTMLANAFSLFISISIMTGSASLYMFF